MKIVLIGAGNVAVHLGPLLKRKGHRIMQVFSRSQKSGHPLAKKLSCSFTSDPLKLNPDADIYIVALTDKAISPFLKKFPFDPNLIVHISGSVGIDIFPKSMKNNGVLYPVQTFSKSSKKSPGKIPFCIEGNNQKSLKIIRKLARTVSHDIYNVNSSERVFIHLAAVFSNNFTNFLFTNSAKILKKKKISFDILKPLIMETALKVQENSPENTQTGPAKRGDSAVIENHLELLKEFPEMKDIYKLLSESISKEFGPRL